MEDFKYFNFYYKNPLHDSTKYYIKSTALLSDINIVQTCCLSTGSDSYEMFSLVEMMISRYKSGKIQISRPEKFLHNFNHILVNLTFWIKFIIWKSPEKMYFTETA